MKERKAKLRNRELAFVQVAVRVKLRCGELLGGPKRSTAPLQVLLLQASCFVDCFTFFLHCFITFFGFAFNLEDERCHFALA